MATEGNWEEILITNKDDLLKYINTEFGLFGELKKAMIFEQLALKKIMGLQDTTQQIQVMLNQLQKKNFGSFTKFCEALTNSEQAHIVRNHLSRVKESRHPQITNDTTDAPLDEDSPACRKVSPGVLECFRQHWNELLHDITFDHGLLAQVEIRKIFTAIQLNGLKDMQAEVEQTKQILRMLEVGTEEQFLDFCDALKANNQSHIVKQYLTPKISEPKIAEPSILVIHDKTTQSRQTHRGPEIHKISEIHIGREKNRSAPEGSSGVISQHVEVSVKGIHFSPCSQEFLNDFKDKVLKKKAYNCDSKPRGRALIMNNKFFAGLGNRDGSDMDTKNLKELFKCLNFDTDIHSDKNAWEMWDVLVKESSKEYHKKYDMFVLFLMSHGINGEIYGIDGKSIKTADVVNLFNGKNCPNLLAKPKLFFIQACQGHTKTEGVMSTDAGIVACDSAMPAQHHGRPTDMEQMKKHLCLDDDINLSIPLEPLPVFQSDAVADVSVHEMADMAIIYATVQGYVAYRRTDRGSLFVNCLIEVLTKQAHEMELLRMVTETFNLLHDLEVKDNQGSFKQIGEKRDSLRKEVYLLPQ